ncbi:MAG: tetratricopeptide repeat protein [Acidobacteria bacterium]|nr:tetratricopeptide repeat protein [Acidobacteriota bacterium]
MPEANEANSAEAIEALLHTGYQARREQRPAAAMQAFAQAAELAEAIPAPHGTELTALAVTGLGQMERDQGRLDQALSHYQQAAALFRATSNAARLAHTVRHVGDIYRHMEQPTLAGPCYEEALALYRALPETGPGELANALRSWALHQEGRAAAAEVAALWRQTRDLYSAAGIDAGVAECDQHLAALAPDPAI